MSKHTPGPWVADINRGYGFPFRPTPNIPINPVVMGRAVNRSIAKVPRGYEEAEANARLIAAAPELLEALQLIVKTCAFQRGESPTFDVAIAAIAKATGEQQ